MDEKWNPKKVESYDTFIEYVFRFFEPCLVHIWLKSLQKVLI
jgi:hypothetical protein